METVMTIKPNKKNLTWLEKLGYAGVFTDVFEMFEFALKKSKARAFKVRVYEAEKQQSGVFILGKMTDEQVITRKYIEQQLEDIQKAIEAIS